MTRLEDEGLESLGLTHVLGDVCPHCGSSEIEGDSVETGIRTDTAPNEAHQEMRCLACEGEWYDVYRLSRQIIVKREDT